MTGSEAFALVARATFEPFNEFDFETFSGVETENPLIAEIDDLVLILDGNVLEVIHNHRDSERFILAGL